MEKIVIYPIMISRSCKNCAYLRKTGFKKRSRHYGRIIYWCKKTDLNKPGPYVNPAKDIETQVCKLHETKEERRIKNDKIKERIQRSITEAKLYDVRGQVKRIKTKEW